VEILPFLNLMAKKNASDLYLVSGSRAMMKVDRRSIPIGDKPLPGHLVQQAAYSVMNEEQIREFDETWECNLAMSVEGVGRFRVNVFRQRGSVGLVFRYIRTEIPSIEELRLPSILKDLINEPRGLILVVGSTGSGKSTTLAAMVDHRNSQREGHILTIEDPIEFLHRHNRSVVSQREIGLDTRSYSAALKNALREAPDLIVIGEIRDMGVMQHAISYAETGHLCLSTLHANNANQALDRVINFFPESAHRQLLMDLSLNLKAVVSQRLIRTVDGTLTVAVEVFLVSKYIAELIRKGELHELRAAMQESQQPGMQTFDQALFDLFRQGRITLETALENAESANDLSLRIRLEQAGSTALEERTERAA
jgi:twitching motility protein PilU